MSEPEVRYPKPLLGEGPSPYTITRTDDPPITIKAEPSTEPVVVARAFVGLPSEPPVAWMLEMQKAISIQYSERPSEYELVVAYAAARAAYAALVREIGK